VKNIKPMILCGLLTFSLTSLAQVPCSGNVMKINDQGQQFKSKVEFKITRNDEYFMDARAQVDELNLTIAVNIANLVASGRIISRQKGSELISTTAGTLLDGLTHTVQDDEHFLKITCKK
jgi:hypothetical protein